MSVGKKSPAGIHTVDKNGWVSYCIKIKIEDMLRIDMLMEKMGVEKASTFMRQILLGNIEELEEALKNEDDENN